jgi:hypothetical protein
MNNTERTAPIEERFRGAFVQLQKAINSAPIAELVAPIEDDLQLKSIPHRERLRSSIENLAMRAALAHPDAIHELVHLGSWIKEVLDELTAKPASQKPTDSTAKAATSSHAMDEGLNATIDWHASINASAELLRDVLDEGGDKLERELAETNERFPPACLSSPWNMLVGYNEPPNANTRLVTDLCDRMIQSCLTARRRRLLKESNTQVADQHDTPPGWDAQVRKPDGPTELTRPIYIALASERSRFRSGIELAELRAEEDSWPSPRKFIKDFVAEQKIWRLLPDGQAPPETLSDTLPASLKLRKAWADRAALLPQLTNDRAAIRRWVDAGFFWILAAHRGALEEVRWASSIMKRIESAESTDAGIRLFLREGFETLAGKDRTRDTP